MNSEMIFRSENAWSAPLNPHQARSASRAFAAFHPGANFILRNDFPTLCCGNAAAEFPFKPFVPGHQVIDGFLEQFVRSAMRSCGELIQPCLRLWLEGKFHTSSLAPPGQVHTVKKWDNHWAYNFCRVRKSLRITPAGRALPQPTENKPSHSRLNATPGFCVT